MKTKEDLRRKSRRNFLRFGCLPIVILIGITIIASLIWPADNYSRDKTYAAYHVSKTYVKQQLEFPESADFTTLPLLSEVQEHTDSIYRVVADVTATNAYGVKKKFRYNIRMKYKGGEIFDPSSWEVVSFNF